MKKERPEESELGGGNRLTDQELLEATAVALREARVLIEQVRGGAALNQVLSESRRAIEESIELLRGLKPGEGQEEESDPPADAQCRISAAAGRRGSE